ncbi:MAG TPA: hypothetical protein VF649_06140 [Sphingomonas sp.]|jgi:hypothetical protein
MFHSDLKHVILSSIGALLLSATCVVAAVGPARAADTAGAATALRY